LVDARQLLLTERVKISLGCAVQDDLSGVFLIEFRTPAGLAVGFVNVASFAILTYIFLKLRYLFLP
jgi:hypothetical protein